MGIHRQFSELSFDPLEIISTCAPIPPHPCSRRPIECENIHTARCLKSIEAQVRLLALPMRQVTHTPFTVCMIATGTISLLAACKFLLVGQKLAIARHQIRMSIGHLKSFANVWPKAERSLQEIQTIAREVLGRPPSQQNHVRPVEVASNGDGSISALGSGVTSACGLSPSSMEGLQAYLDFSNLYADLTWPAGY